MQPDGTEAHRHRLVHAKRAPEVEVTFGVDGPSSNVDLEGGRYRAQGHSGARDERLQEHVSGAEGSPIAAGCLMEPRCGKLSAGLHVAGDPLTE